MGMDVYIPWPISTLGITSVTLPVASICTKALGSNTPLCGASLPSPPITDLPVGASPWLAAGRLKPSIRLPPTAAPTDTPSFKNVRRFRPSGARRFCASSNPRDMSRPLGGVLDRGTDTVVRTAAADVARHCSVDIGIRGVGVRGDQRSRRHHLTRLTVPALHNIERKPCLLHFLARGRGADGLDSRHLSIAHRCYRQHAGAHGLTVEMDCARPALRDTAAKFCARQTDQVTQHPEKRHVGRGVDRVRFAVDG